MMYLTELITHENDEICLIYLVLRFCYRNERNKSLLLTENIFF